MRPRHNDTVRQYPRTLEQAFGPHCNKHIDDSQPLDWQDVLVYAASAAAAAASAILIVIGYVR